MLMAIIMMLSLTTSVFAADPPASAEPEVIVEEAAQNSPAPSASPAPGDDPSRLSTVYEGHRIHYIDSKKQPLPKNAELFMNEINEDDVPFYLQRAAHSLGLESCGMYLYFIADPLLEDASTAEILKYQANPDDPEDRMTVEVTLIDDSKMTDEEKELRLEELQNIHLEDLQVIQLGVYWDYDTILPHSEENGVIRFEIEKIAPFILFIPDWESAVQIPEEPEPAEVPEEIATPVEDTGTQHVTEPVDQPAELAPVPEETVSEVPVESTADTQAADIQNPEPASAEEPVEEVYAQTVTASGSDYSVSLTYTADANIPEGSMFELSELPASGILYDNLTTSVASTLNAEAEEISSVTFVDVDVKKDGDSVPLDAPVSVSIAVDDPADGDTVTQVVALGQQNEVLNTEEGTVGTFSSTTENLDSTYAIVRVTKQVTLKTSDDQTWQITVTYDRDDPAIPTDVELSVKELKEGDPGYDEYLAAGAAVTGADRENLAFAKAFDICLIDPATGAECQPTKEVSVSVQLLEEEVDEKTQIDVVHFGEPDSPEKIDCALNEESKAIEFAAPGFSVYLIMGYTVDFHWSDYTYSIAGESEITLSALFEKLGVTEITLADITDLSFSNPEYIAIEWLDSDWLLRSLAPFSTVESLTLTLNNGKTVQIKVTDEQTNDSTDGETGEQTDGQPDDGEGGDSADTITITWKNWDGTVLETDEDVQDGDTPSYDGETPTKPADEEGHYYFVGWGPEIVPVAESAEYTAQFVLCTPLTITADSDSKIFDGTELTKDSYTLTGNLAEGDSITSVTVNGSQTEVGNSENVPNGACIVNAGGVDVTAHYFITYISGTLEVRAREVTITAGSAEKVYDGEALTTDTWTSTELAEGDYIQTVKITGSQTNAGSSDNTPTDAVIVDRDGNPVTMPYTINYVNGTLTVKPKGVTLTANSDTVKHNSEVHTVSGFTCSVNGLNFEGVEAAGSGTDVGIYDVAFTGVILNETRDTTGNYVVNSVVKGLLIIIKDSDDPNLIRKELTVFNGDLASYKITANPEGLILNAGDPLTIKDTFSDNQSINYASITVNTGTGEDVTYDYSGNTGTYTVPDGTAVTITYRTRVKGDAGEEVAFSNTAVLGRMEDGAFAGGPTDTVTDTETISPTGSDISGEGGVYSIDLFVYAENHMEEGLEGATFRLLDGNMQPLHYRAGAKTGQPVTFTTGSNGYVTIALDEETDGLSIHKNTAYYLEMITAPYQNKDGEYIYYQKDNTFYSFLITDDPDYTYGGIYSYFNGDVLKVRCYPEAKGVNVTKRFSGSYTLTDEQKNAITFILQKEALDTETGWVNVESHTYSEFRYGSMNFSAGKAGGPELEDNTTYRVIEENVLPPELEGIIEEKVSVTVTYQLKGKPVEENTNEFYIDPDDKLAYSYNLAFTDEYIDHKLTIIKIDENNGSVLQGAEFTVFPAGEGTDPVAVYTTDSDGKLTIRRNDPDASYLPDTLYYAVETAAPEHYILPENPEKTYFYFPENFDSPRGLPPGEKAIDLTNSYSTVTVANISEMCSVPVTVVWGIRGDAPWPDDVSRVIVGLYQSVGGAVPPVQVTDDQGQPRTLTLTKERYYDTSSFTGLPAEEDGKTIHYTIVEEGIYDTNGADITDQFARSSSISGTGWYVINNQPAASVTVQKEWYDQDGVTPITDTSGKPDVTFALYRTTTESSATSFTRAELLSLLNGAEPVRTGLTLSGESNWSITVNSLEKTDKQGHLYYYYAIEDIPPNQVDNYTVAAATAAEPRSLTIRNTQTPITVTIIVDDLEKTYGEEDPTAYTFRESSVMEEGASISVFGPDDAEEYTGLVTAADGTTKAIKFTVSREEGENVGPYVITPSGVTPQEGYRVLYETGTLTINQAQATITAGAQKTYGDEDPALVTIEGLKEGDTLSYEVSREEGEDVGEYPITLTGETDQGNYEVTFVRYDDEGNPYTFIISPAPVTVTPDNAEKTYGEDDPEFSATVSGLKNGDDPSVIIYDLNREPGEDVGEYTITPTGEHVQDNYTVTFETGLFTIKAALLKITMEPAEKTYGDPDPEWDVDIEGLQRGEDDGELTSVLDEETGVRTYTYSVTRDGETVALFEFTAARLAGEDVGNYPVTLSTDKKTQGNYILTEAEQPDPEALVTITTGTLMIMPAELTVTPKHQVKAIDVVEDPVLEADIDGWRNGDGESTSEYTVTLNVDDTPTVTWTYTRGTGEAAVTLLTFTLKRDKGEEEGEYNVTAAGSETQSNYTVYYEQGIFSILSILDIDVTQPVVDYVDAGANPSYSYTATLDLTGTGLDEYNKNGFEPDDEGVPTQNFVLPDPDTAEDMKTLQVPAGAKLTVIQNRENSDYTTGIKQDGSPYSSPEGPSTFVLEHVDTYHEIAFTHTRISLPVEARAADGQEETGAKVLPGRKGAMGVPRDESGNPKPEGREIDAGFADEMHSRIGYELPADKYYVYDHASLYADSGTKVDGATDIVDIRYIKYIMEDGSDTYKWQYRVEDGEFTDVPADTKLVLFYLPKFVCKIGETKFYSITDAVKYAKENGGTAKVEMLIGEYSIRSASDAVTIPGDCNITITTAETEYEGEGTAVIGRSLSYPNGHLFYNDGKLTFDDITLDGEGVQAGDALVLNRAANAELKVNTAATLQNAIGVNGGAIYVNNGTVTVDGKLSGNTATVNGGAIYVNSGTVDVSGTVSGSTAASGGAVYVNDGTVDVSGIVSGSTATNGGAIYINRGPVTLTGTLTDNEAANGGAVYQNGGTLTVSGSMTENSASANGGGVYLNNGTLTVESQGSLSGNTAANNGGGIFQAGGTLTNGGTIGETGEGAGNSAANGGGIYRVGGTLTVGGKVSGNSATSNGGGIYTNGDTLNVNAELTGNRAINGGAVYAGGAALNLNGASLSGNEATGNGGAVYALNTTTTIGTADAAATLSSNTAAGNGGAVYMEGGSLTVQNANSELTGNGAVNGGGIYATSGAITVENGKLESNEANANGGAIYAASASVTVKGGTLGGSGKGNKAKLGNGGAIYSGSDAVTISSGTLSGNSASRGERTDTNLGLGGAVYSSSGTVNYTGGNINGGNTAVNGAAIFVGTGIANISASITGNTATEGGAVGVGSTDARLYFTGNANVYDNKLDSNQRNVCLDVDSELVINALTLSSGKKIGVYVPGEIDSEQVVKHGDVTAYFGAYTETNNLTNTFKNDRFSDLKVGYEHNRLYWTSELKYDIYYLSSYSSSQFPPATASPSKTVVTDKSYVPRTRESNIYDLVMAMKLYEAHNTEFTNRVGANYASLAVYAYTFSDKDMGNFGNYLKSVQWDGAARKWTFTKQDGTPAPDDTSKLVIFYSSPAYLTIVNNDANGLKLNISEIGVLGYNVAEGLYGYVTAKNGATIPTLRTVTEDDLEMNVGDSIKLMFPGAQGQLLTLKGTMSGAGASYTFTGGSGKIEQTLSGTELNLSGADYKLNSSDTAAELIFGEALPICKIGDVPFQTLKAAMNYAIAQKTATGSNTYTIEMLVDYLVPKDDVLEIPAGYNIIFTTSQDDDFTGSRKKDPTKEGSYNQAILSRDTGNSGASVKASNSTLTVENLAFDGRSLTASGAGGAISTDNCATVTVKNCEFKGYRADKGGAVYVNNTADSSSLTVKNCIFTNCQTNASVDKAGGGGIWTTARELYVRNCQFEDCACLKGSAQAGAVFHNIQANWFANSKTWISDCSFEDCFSAQASGGTVESDAKDITILNCSFKGSYSSKPSGSNGGALNVYAENTASTSKDCILRVVGCTFEDCNAKLGTANGGAIRTTTKQLLLWGCTFKNTQSVTGGAVSMTNSNATKLEIYSCTFEDCVATGNGGAVSASVVPTVFIGDAPLADTDLGDIDSTKVNLHGVEHVAFTDCTANRGGGIDNNKDGASVDMQNVQFTGCTAKTSNGGALYTKAQTLSITGTSNTFTNCTGYGSGGAIYQLRNADKSIVTLNNCVFSGCEAFNNGNGGGVYANARTLRINYDKDSESAIEGAKGSFENCTAANAGGGLYHDYAGTVTIANCGFENCTAKAASGGGLYTTAHTLTIRGENSKFEDCKAQTDGGGLYHNRNANGSSFTLRDGSFTGCTATGNNGGAIYSPAKTVTLKDCSITGSIAKAQGGGIWINPSTASFDGCTVTGNSVTNSDSKGGSVYVGDGTTEYKNNSTVIGSAANGGGWYQNKGILYILGGSISGSATNGGGVYIYDKDAKVRQYAGTVSGTATANGGGVYKNNGSFTIGNETYKDIAYSGATVGTVTTDEDGNPVYSATAVNGGGVYNNGGTGIYINSGANIVGQASANGGGIWNKSNVEHRAGDVSGSAVNGGGVWQTDTTNGKYTLSGGTVTGTASENGGAFYQGGNFLTINGGALGRKTTTDGEGNETVAATSSAKNGGGLYVAAGTATLNAGAGIASASASENGGGVYVSAGTFNLSGGTVKKNTALGNGGGVYYAGGTVAMSGGTVGGTSDDANTADKGAGVFVVNKQLSMSGGQIRYNRASTEGGGIAVSGSSAKLTFSGSAAVRENTMGSSNTLCNVYLDQDRNTLIQNGALNADAYIGVYASDEQFETHGQSGMHFGTRGNDNNLDCFHNDRIAYLYGVRGSGSLIDWANFVCKITDGDGNLLYKDTEGKVPAVYGKLENNGGTGNDSAFGVLSQASPALYQRESSEIYTGSYQIQMLVPEYFVTQQMKLTVARNITLTTASVEEDEWGFHFTGDPRFPQAVITRQANYGSMIDLKNNSLDFAVSNLILDGGSGSGYTANTNGGILLNEGARKITFSNAVLRNSKTNNNGAGIRMEGTDTILELNNTSITYCVGGEYGGGISIRNNAGTLVMKGGSITNCSAQNGGGIRIDTRMEMNGGTISGNSATVDGGGISVGNIGTKLLFSGNCQVTGNTLNGARCNVQLGYDSDAIINANGLNARSEIGVYTPGSDTDTNSIHYKHGIESKSFGSRNPELENDNFYCFVNDRHTNLRGYRSVDITNMLIYWEYHPLLMVIKTVVSDWPEDQKKDFTFTVQLALDGVTLSPGSYGDMNFNRNGEATVKVKAGESKTAILPDSLHLHDYTVTEVLTVEQQQEAYTTTANKDGKDYQFLTPLTVAGTLGENVGQVVNPTSLSDVIYTNTRMTGNLTVAKEVIASSEEGEEKEREENFLFKLTLDPGKADTITKTYSTVKKDSSGTETDGKLSFDQGVAEFTLKHGESLTVLDLPTDLPYRVDEILTDSQKAHVRTSVQKDEEEEHYATSQTGIIGDHKKTVAVEGVSKEIYASDIVFTNSFLEIVCKITNRSRVLLYYKDGKNILQPAIFSHLEDAFDMLNSGNLWTATGGRATGNMRIEMVVPEYTMERTATLDNGKTVILSTALFSDSEFPYNNGVDDGKGISQVTRGFTEGSMIVDQGSLTLDKITLDGGAAAEEPITGIADGGIVQVAGAVRLTVNSSATLQNSAVTGSEESGGVDGSGGAVWLTAGASLTMNGTIQNCTAADGGGVYAANGFTTVTLTGQIADCEAASGDGGAIFAGTGTSVNLNAGTVLTGNDAANNGGAVYSNANLVLRGIVGGTAENKHNTAGNEGGGIYMGSNAMFTMYAGSAIIGNTAKNGGGLSVRHTTRIAGGSLDSNEATKNSEREGGFGGALYAAEDANVTVSGTAAFADNRALLGGAVYDRGIVNMSGGSMTGNIASAKGGAVFVADTAGEGGTLIGHSFSMTGGRINDGNKSPEGAISTDAHAVLTFSGNSVVSGNTGYNGETAMNVYLGFDSNEIIRTTGLGNGANIGVYVADGEPEDPSSRPDAVVNPIYADHGVGGRNFGTYTGSSISGARLNKFINDRDTVLTGVNGEQRESVGYYVAWKGKGLQLVVTQYLPKLDEDGNVVQDEDGNPVLSETPVPVQNALFTFTNITYATNTDITDATEEDQSVLVWRGKSDANGLVSIPWDGNETEGGTSASFRPGSKYRLDQTAADGKTVLPAGHWTVEIHRDNSVEWNVIQSEEESVDRIFGIASPGESGEKAYLGETFGLKNDVKPTITFDAAGGRLKDNSEKRTDSVNFKTTEINHEYTIIESNPTWGSHVFKQWATMEKEPEVELETEGMTEQEIAEAREAALKAQGYYEYNKDDSIIFFRGTDSDDPAVKYTGSESKGNMTLYAQWDAVVCKITTTFGGDVLYESEGGYPAAYGTLKEGFEALNSKKFVTKDGTPVRDTATLYLEMLVDNYTMTEPVENNKRGTVVLTTAPWSSTNTDGYPYSGDRGTVCTIYRGSCDTSLITNNRNLMLRDIALDGGNPQVQEQVIPVCDGGFIYNSSSSVLTIGNNATLQNSSVEGNGGAVNLASGSSLTMSGGTIKDCNATGNGNANGFGGAVYVAANATASVRGGTINGNTAVNGAGIYLTAGSTLNLSGNPNFGGPGTDTDGNFTNEGNFVNWGYTAEANEKNGGKNYTNVRQDIYIAGYENDPAASLAVTGNITSGNGTIWVWAEYVGHYEMLNQFAVIRNTAGTVNDNTYKAFRNARPDSVTLCGGDYLTGRKGDDPSYIYWTGGFDVQFKKIDGFGEPLPNAVFTLYEAVYNSGTNTIDMGDTTGRTAKSSNGDIPDPNNPGAMLPVGTVLFEKVPTGVYYMRETATPSADYVNNNTYIVLVGESTLEGAGTDPRSGIWASNVLSGITNDNVNAQISKDIIGEPQDRVYAIFLIGGTTGKEAVATPDIAKYGVLNVSTSEKTVILSKVNQVYSQLSDGRFIIYRFDRSPLERDNEGEPMVFSSDSRGVYFVGSLPYGTYLVEEIRQPAGYRMPSHYFVFTVTADGVKNENNTTTNTILESEKDDFNLP